MANEKLDTLRSGFSQLKGDAKRGAGKAKKAAIKAGHKASDAAENIDTDQTPASSASAGRSKGGSPTLPGNFSGGGAGDSSPHMPGDFGMAGSGGRPSVPDLGGGGGQPTMPAMAGGRSGSGPSMPAEMGGNSGGSPSIPAFGGGEKKSKRGGGAQVPMGFGMGDRDNDDEPRIPF